MIRVSTRRAADAADALDGEVLDGAQQLRLRRRREVRDLVEKQRAVVRRLELAPPAAHAGGGALLDPEQLRLDQGLDDRGAVDGDERAAPAATEFVDLPRDELLAGARFAFDQDGEVGGRDALDSLAHGRGWRALDPINGAAPSSRRGRRRRPRALDLHEQRGDMRADRQRAALPLVDRCAGLEHRFEPGRHRPRRRRAHRC